MPTPDIQVVRVIDSRTNLPATLSLSAPVLLPLSQALARSGVDPARHHAGLDDWEGVLLTLVVRQGKLSSRDLLALSCVSRTLRDGLRAHGAWLAAAAEDGGPTPSPTPLLAALARAGSPPAGLVSAPPPGPVQALAAHRIAAARADLVRCWRRVDTVQGITSGAPWAVPAAAAAAAAAAAGAFTVSPGWNPPAPLASIARLAAALPSPHSLPAPFLASLSLRDGQPRLDVSDTFRYGLYGGGRLLTADEIAGEAAAFWSSVRDGGGAGSPLLLPVSELAGSERIVLDCGTGAVYVYQRPRAVLAAASWPDFLRRAVG
jgi:hypothetical protein